MFAENQSYLLKKAAIPDTFLTYAMTGVWDIPVGCTMKTDQHYEVLLYCECDGRNKVCQC